MCECTIIGKRTQKPIEVPVLEEKFKFYIEFNGEKHELLDGIPVNGKIDYCAGFAIKEMHGCKKGWMLVFGEGI